jgi:hypothetical protein
MVSDLDVIAAEPNWPIMLPFGILLLAIALGPLIAQYHWETSLSPTLRRLGRRGVQLSRVRRSPDCASPPHVNRLHELHGCGWFFLCRLQRNSSAGQNAERSG